MDQGISIRGMYYLYLRTTTIHINGYIPKNLHSFIRGSQDYTLGLYIITKTSKLDDQGIAKIYLEAEMSNLDISTYIKLITGKI